MPFDVRKKIISSHAVRPTTRYGEFGLDLHSVLALQRANRPPAFSAAKQEVRKAESSRQWLLIPPKELDVSDTSN